jgi:hypothetical protein
MSDVPGSVQRPMEVYMLGKLSRSLVPLAAASLAVLAAPAASAAARPVAPAISVGPDQYFAGLVLGRTSQSVIDVTCAGPASTGHPVAGQSVEVGLLLPPVSTTAGFTGSARSIQADLIWSTAPPPTTVVTHIATFTSYFVKAPIPTTITVPCGGRGVMSFMPVLGGPAARPSTVSVTFESAGV